MTSESDGSIADVAQNLPAMSGNGNQAPSAPAIPAGTVVARDGSIVTLGEKGGRNVSLSSPSNNMNHGK